MDLRRWNAFNNCIDGTNGLTMNLLTLITDSYFDGERHRDAGPYRIEVEDGVIARIERGRPGRLDRTAGGQVVHAPFVMPGLVEAHCHLFLDGGELDLEKRKQYLSASRDQMLGVGRRSLGENLAAGVTLIRDAGDIHGINHQLRGALSHQHDNAVAPDLRSPGCALRKAGRYGSFMALETTDAQSIVQTIRQLAPAADDLKILLTGIIDFEKGQMKGEPQFDLSEARLIVAVAREYGLKTFAHCSGLDGLRIAVKAGIDSVEHGFFMDRQMIAAMADQRIAWVPTFSPVWFQFEHPQYCGWNAASVARLREILDRHFEHVAAASDAGVPIVAGSDAGSYGVPHGQGLIAELFFQRRAGMPLEKVLASATSTPRKLWGRPPADIVPGNEINLLAMDGSPFDSLENLRSIRRIFRRTSEVDLHPSSRKETSCLH